MDQQGDAQEDQIADSEDSTPELEPYSDDGHGEDTWAALGAALRAALLELHYVLDLRVCKWSVW